MELTKEENKEVYDDLTVGFIKHIATAKSIKRDLDKLIKSSENNIELIQELKK